MPETAATPRRVAHAPADRPLLVFDGDCGFCRLWVERWREACGDRLDVAPSHEAAGRFPEIPASAFAEAVQLIGTDGAVTSAADAVLRARALATRRSWLLAAYQHVPGFAPAAESVYRAVASHRPILSWLTRRLWGASVRHPGFGLGTWLFLRLLGLVNLIAFFSFWVQLNGLVGPHGILPAQSFLDAVQAQIGTARFWEAPTLCWFFGAGWFLHALCAIGVVASLALMAGLAPAPCLALLWLVYLSVCIPGQVFMDYQWDALLLEANLLAFFLAPWGLRSWRHHADPARLARWLLWWLLIRLMLLSGATKLLSGDPTWRNLTALRYHFWTQPLPTPLAWYAAQLPGWCLGAACVVMFAIELGAPLLLLLPRRPRHLGAGLLIGLQALIALTGNYTFFNLLTVALCLLFFDDAFWRRLVGRWLRRSPAVQPATVLRRWRHGLLGAVAGLVFAITLLMSAPTVLRATFGPEWLGEFLNAVSSFRSLNSYGLFAVMTRERPELIIEGSDDGNTWRPYAFKDKPGDVRRAPGFVAPHQPRLDWQLWFAALDYPQRDPWVRNLCVRLLQGSPAVLGLFRSNPFPHAPPYEIRVALYDYTFTDRATRAATGRWWDRSPIDLYLEPMSIR